eukprot:8323686-Ditylum_brightwellii.AAC.1
MARAKIGPSNSRFATAWCFTSFPTTMRHTEELATRRFITSWMGTAPSPTMSDAKAGCALCTFGAFCLLTSTITAMSKAIESPYPKFCEFIASLNTTWLCIVKEGKIY